MSDASLARSQRYNWLSETNLALGKTGQFIETGDAGDKKASSACKAHWQFVVGRQGTPKQVVVRTGRAELLQGDRINGGGLASS